MSKLSLPEIFRKATELLNATADRGETDSILFSILFNYSCNCVEEVCRQEGMVSYRQSEPIIKGYQTFLQEVLFKDTYEVACKENMWDFKTFNPWFFSRNEDSQKMRYNALMDYANYLEKQNETN